MTLAPGESPTDAIDIPAATTGRRSAAAAASDGGAAAGREARSISFDLARMGVALVIVLGLIFLARWAVGKLFAGGRAPAAGGAVKVLAKTPLAPRQQILLLQVGRRVIVVGESNGQLATLANLDDPDEVASLIGQLHQDRTEKPSSFGSLFNRAERPYDEEAAPMPTEPPAADAESLARSELSGLADKLRAIRSQLDK